MNQFNGMNDDLLEELPEFLGNIKGVAETYDYICATERRCFNLIVRFLPEIKLLSGSALKLCYEDMAKYYRAHLRFPKMLILDDVMIWGRNLAVLLTQLETLLEDELNDMLTNPEELSRFHSKFTDAVDIYVYAKNRETLFLGERFQRKLQFKMELFAGRLRDLSAQLSWWITKKEIANTSFVCSIRSKYLTDLLENNNVSEDNLWKKVVWDYRGEKMILYTRIYGDEQVNRISTIRFFPDRSKMMPPQLTSFTLLGGLNAQDFSELRENMLRLLLPDCPKLSNIFRRDKSLLRINQGQLLSFILSILDFFDFCQDVLTDNQYLQMTNDLRGDINKIACQFGNREEIGKELARIAGSMRLKAKLSQWLTPWLKQHAEQILPSGAVMYQKARNHYSGEEIWRISQTSEEMFYLIGWQGEKNAAQLNKEPEQFRPDRYQDYSKVNEYGDHGVISLYDYFYFLQRKESDFQSCFYGYLSSFVYMMDTSILSVRVNLVRREGVAEKISLLAKAGELSTFYMPRKLALMVPAFAEIESHSLTVGTEAKVKEAMSFVNFVLRTIDRETLTEFSDEEVTYIRKKMQTDIYVEGLQDDIDKLYQCGQSFRGWDFENLTKMQCEIDKKFQMYLKKSAHTFCERLKETPFTAS